MADQRLLLRIELESFKSIARLDQDLGQLTVLVGENSAGKSSLMQAIVLASQIADSNTTSGPVSLIGSDVSLREFRNILHQGLAADEVTIGLTLCDDTAMSRPWLGGETSPPKTFGWRMTLAAPRPPQVGASLHRVSVSSSAANEEIVISQIDPHSQDPGERDRARELRRLLERSIALTQAGGDASLDIVASAIANEDAALYSGSHRRGSVDPEPLEPEPLEYVSLDGGLPDLALRSTSNRPAAARAFMWMTGADFEGTSQGPDPSLDSDVEEPSLVDRFAEWLSEADDALAARTGKIELPTPADDLSWSDFESAGDALEALSAAAIPTVPDRDHLHRVDLRIATAAENIRDALTRRVHLLGPLRDVPSPVYRPGERGTGLTTLGAKGEFTVAYLDEHGSDLVHCPLPKREADFVLDGAVLMVKDEQYDEGEERPLISAVHLWLRALGIAERVEIRQTGRVLEFDLIDPQTRAKRDLTSVGVGASQILPVVVLCLLAKPGDLVLIEQPELHLHPGPQQVLGDFLLGISQSGRQLIVETHSEYLVNRLRLRIVEQRLDQEPDAIRLLYAQRRHGATEFDELRPDKRGMFGEWPEGFFDQSPKESEAIVRAAVERRRAERSGDD